MCLRSVVKVLGVIGCIGAQAAVAADRVGPYLEAAVGNTNYDAVGLDDGLALRLHLGFAFSPYIALEGGFLDLGIADSSVGEVSVSGIEIGGRLALPIGARAQLFGRAGVLVWEADNGEAFGSVDDGSHADPYLGLGLRYDYSDQLFFGTDITQYMFEEDSNPEVWMVSLGINF